MANDYPSIYVRGYARRDILPASAARYFKGGSLRVLFDEWS
ncbi:MAG: hypothetical protein V3R72_02965 [Gammaproteobacteria bacterium]